MNDDLQDFDLKSEDSESLSESGLSGSPRWPWVVGALVVVLALVAFLLFRRESPEEVAEPDTAMAPAATQVAEPADDEAGLDIGEVPGLVDSDVWLRTIVGQVSSHPQLAEWMLTPELIRGFVVIVDNVAEGKSPRQHLDMATPDKRFTVSEDNSDLYIDPASYGRFDTLVEVIDSLDTEGTAELYQAIRPLAQQAYQDLGYPGEDFDATLRRAIQRVLAVPVVEGPVEVEPKVTGYEFSEPALEELTPAAKQFLRLGPENLERLQAKLRALDRAAGLGG